MIEAGSTRKMGCGASKGALALAPDAQKAKAKQTEVIRWRGACLLDACVVIMCVSWVGNKGPAAAIANSLSRAANTFFARGFDFAYLVMGLV